jgi:membrane protein DedA with SNARE-associated domain
MNQITEFLISHGGLFLFVIGFAEQNGLPLPGAPWLLAAGALSASGKFSLFAAIGWTAAGSMAADVIWFFLGHRGKARVFRVFPYLQSVQVRLARATLAKSLLHGMRMLTLSKFLPVGNGVISMHAGALEVSRLRFLVVDAFASVIYASVYAPLGFAFHSQLEQVVAVLQKLGTVSLVLIGVGAVAYVVHWIVKHHQKKEARPDPEKSEVEGNICFPSS